MEEFNLDESGIQEILRLAMAKGGNLADIYCQYSRYSSLILEEGILKTAISDVDRGVGIRVVKGERTGYAYTEILEPERFRHAAKIAAAIAADRGSDTPVNLTPRHIPNFYAVNDLSIDEKIEDKIAWLNMADQYARQYSNKITKVNVSLTDQLEVLLMVDSNGNVVSDTRPMLRITVSVIAEVNGIRQKAKRGDGGRVGFSFLTEARIKHWAEEAGREALTLLDARQAPAGTLPVILGPGESGILLHESIGHPLEADFNRKGTSAYTGRMGEQVADPQCTIIDDGTVSFDRGSINVDDELNASQRTVLIENGRLVSYMYDEISAAYFGVPSSGNGRRESYKYQPLPRMRSTYMLPGKYDPEEILSSTERGIYCKTFQGGQVDISNGNFVFVPNEAYLVEKGKITHPIKNLTLIGNGPEVLSKVSMVGSDFRMSSGVWTCGKGQSVPVGVGMPTIKISEMTVGGQ